MAASCTVMAQCHGKYFMYDLLKLAILAKYALLKLDFSVKFVYWGLRNNGKVWTQVVD